MRTPRPHAFSTALWLVCSLSLQLSCSSSTGPDASDDDTRSPAPINDLRVAAFTAHSVTLAWTATGDDDEAGTAARYEVRRHDVFIHPATWDAAVVIPDPPHPSAAGAAEAMTVVDLAESHTYFFALTAFDESNNSFGVSNCVSVTCFDDIEVVFPDAGLEAAVRARLDIPTGPLRRQDLRELVDVDGMGRGISDLTGLQECIHLSVLHMLGNAITDLTPIAGLVELRHVNLASNAVIDLAPVSGLAQLEKLWLNDNLVVDVTPLTNLTQLQSLQLERNAVRDVTPLAGLTALTELLLRDNQITSLAPLSDLTELRKVTVAGNEIGSLGALSACTAMEVLDAVDTGVVDVSALTGLTALRWLYLANNRIADASPLASLTSLVVLHLNGNQISSIPAVANLTGLEQLHVAVNAITDLSPVTNLTALQLLQASYNQITDLAPLVANAGLGDGDLVEVRYNPLSAAAVDTQIPELVARGVTVHY